MAKKQAKTAQLAPPPQAADDFKAISGINPAVERRLHDAGVRTYAQLAAMTPASLAQLLAGSSVSIDRVSRQDWIAKARELSTASPTPLEETELVYRQHYVMFTVRLLLSEENEVRYTEVKHVQSEDKKNWAGWDEPALVQFFAEHAKFKLPPLPLAAAPQPVEAAPAPIIAADMAHGAAPAEMRGSAPLAIAMADVVLNEVESQLPNGKAFSGQRLRAQVAFDLIGDDARAAAATESAFIVQALAREQTTGQTKVLGTADGQLRADVLSYSTSIEFDLPPVGRYQIFGMVLLPHELITGIRQGPTFKVVP